MPCHKKLSRFNGASVKRRQCCCGVVRRHKRGCGRCENLCLRPRKRRVERALFRKRARKTASSLEPRAVCTRRGNSNTAPLPPQLAEHGLVAVCKCAPTSVSLLFGGDVHDTGLKQLCIISGSVHRTFPFSCKNKLISSSDGIAGCAPARVVENAPAAFAKCSASSRLLPPLIRAQNAPPNVSPAAVVSMAST